MEAKDTVINKINRDALSNTWFANPFKDKPKEFIDNIILDTAQIQAEISFKAGRKEVVEWIREQVLTTQNIINVYPEDLEAMLKEWGIVENEE